MPSRSARRRWSRSATTIRPLSPKYGALGTTAGVYELGAALGALDCRIAISVEDSKPEDAGRSHQARAETFVYGDRTGSPPAAM
jgi:hypothetical protein